MVALFMLAACSSIDCPLNNRVYATFRLDGDITKMEDTLTVAVPRSIDYKDNDTVIHILTMDFHNHIRLADFDSIALPMSYQRTTDVYVFTIKQKDSEVSTTDTVWVAKQNDPHFESVDCNPQFFHTITDVKFTTEAIENITINYNKVTYNDGKAHFLIRFKGHSN